MWANLQTKITSRLELDREQRAVRAFTHRFPVSRKPFPFVSSLIIYLFLKDQGAELFILFKLLFHILTHYILS